MLKAFDSMCLVIFSRQILVVSIFILIQVVPSRLTKRPEFTEMILNNRLIIFDLRCLCLILVFFTIYYTLFKFLICTHV